LPELLFRYRARNFPQSLTEAETARWREHCRAKLQDTAGFSLATFQVEMAAELSLKTLDDRQRRALTDLQTYVDQLAAQLA